MKKTKIIKKMVIICIVLMVGISTISFPKEEVHKELILVEKTVYKEQNQIILKNKSNKIIDINIKVSLLFENNENEIIDIAFTDIPEGGRTIVNLCNYSDRVIKDFKIMLLEGIADY